MRMFQRVARRAWACETSQPVTAITAVTMIATAATTWELTPLLHWSASASSSLRPNKSGPMTETRATVIAWTDHGRSNDCARSCRI
jgi:hypothetical protein